jgi:hypothetical protein
LYLLHAPYGGKENRLGAWKALVEAVEAGKVRSIGVSNYGVHHLEELEQWIKETEAKEGKGKGGVLSVNQVELHPWLARRDIVKWCEDRGVLLEVREMAVLCLRITNYVARLIRLLQGRNARMKRHLRLWPRSTTRSGRKSSCAGVFKWSVYSLPTTRIFQRNCLIRNRDFHRFPSLSLFLALRRTPDYMILN